MSDRLERLLNLTAALLSASRPLSAAEIRERVPGYPEDSLAAFRRAFERDKEALREMGIPLGGGDDGYVIPRDEYELRDPGLDPDELAALHLATAAVRLEGLRGTEAIWKLGGAPTAAGGEAVAALPAIPQLVPLFAAVAARAPVTFHYRGEARTVDPWRLSFSRGRWYLDGFDHDRGAERQFRLDRLEGDVVAGEAGSFTRPAASRDAPEQPWLLGGDDPVTARVRVDADQAAWAVDHLGPEAVADRRPDRTVDFELEVTNRHAFRSFVLGFLDHAEVLGPPELRDDLVAYLRALAG